MFYSVINKRLRKPKGLSRMDNPETQAILDTRNSTKTNKTKNAVQKAKKISNTDPAKKPCVNPG